MDLNTEYLLAKIKELEERIVKLESCIVLLERKKPGFENHLIEKLIRRRLIRKLYNGY